MKLTTADVCPRTCFIKHNIDINNEIAKLRNDEIQNIEIPITIKDSQVNYSPVGNYAKDPVVIISGKTPSDTTQQAFISRLKDGQSLDCACYETIYANMRDNLYKYFNRVGLFTYLSKMNSMWTGDSKVNWLRLFSDYNFARNCGIQLTQACNCAILNTKSDRKGKSAEPNKSAFNKIQQEFGCLFKHFTITENTRLIIFLDTPSKQGNKFHQEFLWEKLYRDKYPHVKVMSITHPSTNNMIIYNSLDDIEKMPENSKKKKAVMLYHNAERTISELMQEL